MRGIRKLHAVVGIIVILASVLAPAAVMTESAAAAGCQSPSIGFGRWKWCGYFSNKFQDSGEDVRIGGLPVSVGSTSSFYNMIMADYVSGDAHRQAAASFIILTMDGQPLPSPARPVGLRTITNPDPSHPISQDWLQRMQGYGNISENGSHSVGTSGSIDWFVSMHTACGTINTYYQPAYNDIAPFTDDTSNSQCGNPNYKASFIIFRNTAGTPVYIIRRACMNPIGTLTHLAPPPSANYNLTPTVNAQVGDGSSSVAEEGDQITFSYTVQNSGSSTSASTTCNTYANIHPGYFDTPSNPENSGPAGPGTGCPRVFGGNSTTTVATETITATTGNETICRSLFVNPADPAGDRRGDEVCVVVAAKPYAKVYGGDVSVGNGFTGATSTCTSNQNGTIVGWNQRAGGGFAGGGTEYAAMVMNVLQDFATAQGGAAGSAPTPSGLAFSNQGTNATAGTFGTSMGSLPCIPDYYGTKPTTTTAFTGSVNGLATGNYAATGTTTVTGGTLGSGAKVTVYVDGDVYISNNISYGSGWDVNHVPMFELVARGNIYIGSGVSQLDGVYVAQGNSGDGTIYTCATSAAPLALDGNLFGVCNTKLTVNGSLVAGHVQLLRTRGSLGQSSVGEGTGSSAAAEEINYNPSLWLAQPNTGSGSQSDYDAITSLPPIL
ncbi:MAG TPA: hypothetical protein VHT70_03085 [Candidatus Saccharimonadales bacterium]|jgi:hypothetical protein|nr:hypothetical protein [Candidatus Saccharimonadales bacterium]